MLALPLSKDDKEIVMWYGLAGILFVLWALGITGVINLPSSVGWVCLAAAFFMAAFGWFKRAPA